MPRSPEADDPIRPMADIAERINVAAMQKTRTERLKEWARDIKRDVVALWLGARDPRVKWYAKAVAAAVAAYALSPIDLIPDFIPVIGYVDDLLIVPLGILLAVKLIPPPLMTDLRRKSSELSKPTSVVGLLAVLTIWFAIAGSVAWLFWSRQ